MKSHAIDPRYDGYLYHYYRAEVYRETNWRNRLDVTTNWSIVVTAAILSYLFGNENVPNGVLVLNYLIVLFFLYMESRRFRYYAMLKKRTRLIESLVLSKIFVSPSTSTEQPSYEDIEALTKSLDRPRLTISKLEAIAWRTRRIYIFLVLFLYITWLDRLALNPVRSDALAAIVSRAGMWFLPGWVVLLGFTLSVVALLLLAVYLPLRSVDDDLP